MDSYEEEQFGKRCNRDELLREAQYKRLLDGLEKFGGSMKVNDYKRAYDKGEAHLTPKQCTEATKGRCACGVRIERLFYIERKDDPSIVLRIGSVCIDNFLKDIAKTFKHNSICMCCKEWFCERKNAEYHKVCNDCRDKWVYIFVRKRDEPNALLLGAKFDDEFSLWICKATNTEITSIYKVMGECEFPSMSVLYNTCFINVPFKRKDEAKEGGARWDASAKLWYCSCDNWWLIHNFGFVKMSTNPSFQRKCS